MSAAIIAFPIAAARPPACLPVYPAPVRISATALATKFADHFLPICQASIDLLETDELLLKAVPREGKLARSGPKGAIA